MLASLACDGKVHFSEGTARTRHPKDTVEWLWPVARQIGVTRLANVTGLDVIGIPVWLAIRPNSQGLATSQGKGISDDAAAASALMEAVESWHAENIVLPVEIASPASMATRAAILDPLTIAHYADSPPRADMPLAWIAGTDLMSDEAVRVPYEAVSTNYVVAGDRTFAPTMLQSSNGLAGGNHLLEAINQGLAEVIERHAIAAHEDRIRAFDPGLRIDPGSVTETHCRRSMEAFGRAGVDFALFDITGPVNVPSYCCTILDSSDGTHWRALPPFNGYGCHLNPAIALSRALTEAAQSRLTHISGSRDDILDRDYARGQDRADLAAFRKLMDRAAYGRKFANPGSESRAQLGADTQSLLSALDAAGFDRAICVELTHADLGVPVVKVLVPGLQVPKSLIAGRTVNVRQRSTGARS